MLECEVQEDLCYKVSMANSIVLLPPDPMTISATGL